MESPKPEAKGYPMSRENKYKVTRETEAANANENFNELVSLAEEALDAIESALDRSFLREFSATIVIDSGKNKTDVSIEVEGTGNSDYREEVDKHVQIAIREAREKIERRLTKKTGPRNRGAGKP